MKLALITDTHAGARSDSTIFNDHFLRFYDEVFFPYLKENRIGTIIHLGDLFDRRKYINFSILNSWRKNIFEKMNEFKTIVINGNHDGYYKNNNDINSLDELLIPYSNIEVISKNTEIEFDGTNILMMPWIVPDKEADALKTLQDTKSQIVFGHFDIIGFSMYKGLPNAELGFNPSVFEKFDMVVSGHYHHKSSKDNIHYLGAPYEMVWSDYDDERGFHIFDTDTRTLTFIQNPLHIFNKIYYNDTGKTYDDLVANANLAQHEDCYVKVVTVQKNNQYIFDQFLEALYKENPADVSIVESVMDYTADSEAIDESKDTLTILIEYIEALTISKENKQPLIELMKQVYMESLSVEE
jgi:DNA repair exonuclease SbcCD nuclease subunit